VPELALAVQTVRDRGGTAIGPMELPDRTRIAVCEDSQRAAFGLREAVSSMS